MPVVRAYGDYMGCVIEAGDRTVDFRFEPRSFHLGAKITGSGLLASALWLAICFVAKPRPSAPLRGTDGNKPSQPDIANT